LISTHFRPLGSGPEKAGVGGSIPSLATIIPKNLAARSQKLPPKVPPKIIAEFAPCRDVLTGQRIAEIVQQSDLHTAAGVDNRAPIGVRRLRRKQWVDGNRNRQ